MKEFLIVQNAQPIDIWMIQIQTILDNVYVKLTIFKKIKLILFVRNAIIVVKIAQVCYTINVKHVIKSILAIILLTCIEV